MFRMRYQRAASDGRPDTCSSPPRRYESLPGLISSSSLSSVFAFDASTIETFAHLREKLKKGEKTLVGNKGYRIDEERYDGIWILRTNTDLPAEEVALKYKQLWMVEMIFRFIKSILETRPIF